MHHRTFARLALVLLVLGPVVLARADEGMWLFNKPPLKLLKERYNFEPKLEWFERLQKSCVRIGSGGSGSIVSADGLVMTNHHVGRDEIEELSTSETNYARDGFYAKTREEELKCPALEVNILWEIEDATAKVTEGVTGAMSPAEANTARQKKIAEISKQCEDATKLDCEVVTLYHGARYHLYKYKRYDDIRLVMAPEADAANFGGDTDNFEFPRFCLDMTFFRIYDNGKPLKPEHHLNWSEGGVKEGDLTFVAGHPGRTNRLYTLDHLAFQRDEQYPLRLNSLWRREVLLQLFRNRNDENARIAAGDLQGVQNSRKAYMGMYEGLLDPEIMKRKSDDETKLRAAINANPDWKGQWAGAWDSLAAALKEYSTYHDRHSMLERAGGGSDLFSFARTIVRLAEELPKPNTERLREYRDSALDSVYLRLYSSAPIYESLEENRLTSYFSQLAEHFGGSDPFVSRVLAGKTPADRARELVKQTKLKDVAVRKTMVEGAAAAVAASNDPLIRLAYDIDPEARALRKRYEDGMEGVEREAYAKIGSARFAVIGENEYPDATFSLRLTFGEVKGYNDGGAVPAWTTFGGLFERHKQRGGVEPFALPQRWLQRKDRLNLSTPYNFINTADVIGGNSGSPVVDRKGEVVGLVFDGNLQSLVWNTMFTDRVGRTLAVDSRAILESLRKIYEADALVKELTAR